jgi:hypothetical protein
MSGEITYSDGRKVIQRKMTDDELKCMLNNIRLNTGFSFPDQLIQDFMDGDIVPTFKKCIHFNREDFRTLVRPILKRARKRPKRPKTQRDSKRMKSKSKKTKTMKRKNSEKRYKKRKTK